MNEIKITVKFKEHECYFENEKDIKSLISGDYNSTKLVFDFDREDGTKIFEMKNENNEIVYASEIDNNELILVGKDENDNNCTLFTTKGTYAFEITLYGNDSKLTSACGAFSVQPEEVVISDNVAESHLPIFDEMVNNLESALNEVETIDIEVEKEDSTTTVTLTKKDGTTKEIEILDGVDGINGQDGVNGHDGRDGINGITPTIGNNGNWYLGETDTGKPSRGIQGENGQDGQDGQDGFSPIATVTETSDGATISITDKNGTTTAKIYNGTGGGGTSDYRNLENKPQINNVELTGNKTSSDLGLQPAGNYVIDSNYVHTDNNYSSNEKNKLASLNNYDDTEIKQDIIDLKSNIPTKLSDLTNDGNFVTDNNYVHTDNNFTNNLKNKLDGIESEATKTIVDSSITNTSTNPVESKVIYNALNSKLDTSLKGSANGIAELDSNGKILESQLPSYVDDVLDGYYYNNNFYEDSAHTELITGESGKIYIDLATNKTYRWGGSTYVLISETITLGETSSTAYRGDRGKIAYEHSLITSGNPHNVTKSNIGLENVENKSSATIRGEITSSNVTNALGYTPYDSSNPNGYTSNAGTITGIKMNGSTKGTSGIVDLGTVITSHQDITGKENTSNKVTSISSSSTDTEYPSAKAVYDYIQSLDGDEVYY